MRKLLGLLVFSIFLTSSIDLLAQTVYITKSGEKYHSDRCQYLKQSKIEIDLSSAIDKGYGACSKCKPPIQVLKATTSNTQKPAVKQFSSSANIAGQRCSAITKAGTRCSRKAEAGSVYCWQHKK